MSDAPFESMAVLLIAHGSRRDSANRDLTELANQVAARGPWTIVETSYLELAEPTISEGAARCVKQGAVQVLMLPYFLSTGAHVTEDLQRHRHELAAMFPDVTFVLRPPLGPHPLLVELVIRRLEEGAADS